MEKLTPSEDSACASASNTGKNGHLTTFLKALGISVLNSQGSDPTQTTLGMVDATSLKRTIVINVSNSIDLPLGDRLQQFTVKVDANAKETDCVPFKIQECQCNAGPKCC